MYTFWCSIFHFLASAASSSTCDTYQVCVSGFGVVPVVLDIELSVSARYEKTRVLLRARLLLLQQRAAVCGITFETTCNELSEITIWGQSEHQKITIFCAPLCEITSTPPQPKIRPLENAIFSSGNPLWTFKAAATRKGDMSDMQSVQPTDCLLYTSPSPRD